MVSSRKILACKENGLGYEILFGWARRNKNPSHSQLLNLTDGLEKMPQQ
jgi:hypothetical protein